MFEMPVLRKLLCSSDSGKTFTKSFIGHFSTVFLILAFKMFLWLPFNICSGFEDFGPIEFLVNLGHFSEGFESMTSSRCVEGQRPAGLSDIHALTSS